MKKICHKLGGKQKIGEGGKQANESLRTSAESIGLGFAY